MKKKQPPDFASAAAWGVPGEGTRAIKPYAAFWAVCSGGF